MKKPVLLEIDSVRCKILEDTIDEKTGLSTIKAEVKWQAADIINSNKRLYPRSVLEREINRLKPMVAEGGVFGAAYHPEKAAEIPDVATIWRDIKMEESGECTGIVEVLPTSRGKDVQIIMRANGKIGLSSRGSGTFSAKERKLEDGSVVKYDEINEDYHLASPGDFVLTPSVIGAGIKRIIEARYEEADASDSNKDSKMNEEQLKQRIAELEKQLAEEQAKIKALEAQVVEKDTALTEKVKAAEDLTAKIAEAEKAKAKLVEYLRSLIMGASEIPGVIPEPAKAEAQIDPPAADADSTKQIEQLTADKVKLQGEIDAMKKAETDAKAAEEAVKAKAELQAKIKEAFDATVGKPDYKAFEAIVRKELVAASGEILIESVELVEDKVKAVKAKAQEILVEAERAKIVKSFVEKGVVGSPDTPMTNEQTLKLREGFKEALVSGFNGTFAEYVAKTASPKK